jgi:hypothetical protein
MTFYNPSQTTFLNYAMQHDPSLLPTLYNEYNQVQPIDQNQTQQFANQARDQYMRNVTAPMVGAAREAGGTTDNSFAASNAAALQAQGAAQAQGVWNNAYNMQNQNQEQLQAYNQMAADNAWNGYQNAYKPLEAKNAAANPSRYAQMGMNSPASYLYGGSSMSPWNSISRVGSGLGNAAGYLPSSAVDAVGNYAKQGLSGLWQGLTGSGNSGYSPASGYISGPDMSNNPNTYGPQQPTYTPPSWYDPTSWDPGYSGSAGGSYGAGAKTGY